MDALSRTDGVDPSLLAHALQTAPGAFVSIDQDGLISGWNRASEELFGWTAEEVLGRALAETIVPPEHRADHLAGVARVASTGRSDLAGRELMLSGMTRAGDRIPLALTLWPSDGPDGKRFHAHVRDARPEVTSRRAVEQEQSRFERLARVVPGVVYTYVLDEDGEGHYSYVSPSCEELYGFTDEEAVADPSLMPDAVHPDDRAGLRRAQWISGATLAELRWAGRIVHRDRTVRHVTITSRPTVRPDGATEWCGVVLDRTEQDAADRTIARHVDRLGREHAILDAALAFLSEVVVACDADGRVTYMNRAAERLHGHGVLPGADGATATYDLVDPATGLPVPEDRSPLARVLAGEVVEGVRVDVAPSGLPRRRLLASGRLLGAADGEVLGAVVSARDVTAVIGDGPADLEGADRAGGHPAPELRAPEPSSRADRVTGELRASFGRRIEAQLDAVRRGLEAAAHGPGDALDSALAAVGRAVQRLDGLHRDVWSLVALETGRLIAHPSATRLGPALEAAAATAEDPTRVRVECDPDLTAWVQPGHLEQLLLNLVANADEHAGGVTVLRATRAGDHVLVDVEDEGEGVPDEQRSQLFQKLTRAGDRATAARGTALGLYVVRHLAEANHGAVAHQSLARGSRFVVSLPATPG